MTHVPQVTFIREKQRLQQAVFPTGVSFGDDSYRTTSTDLVFFELGDGRLRNKDLVPLTGIEPVFQP